MSIDRRSFTIAVALALAFPAAALAQSVQRDVPFVPTPEHVVKRMLELAQIKPGEFMMDLGSGDGRIAIAAARDYGATAVGIDIDPDRIRDANENARKAGVTDRVTLKQENIFTTSIKEADVITMYLLTTVNRKLRPRLLEELRPGTRLVSHAFDMGEWEADIFETVDGRHVYMWVVPAKVEGEWTVKDGAQTFGVKFDQHFQMLSGTASIDGKQVPVRNGRLNGAEIVFTVDIDGKPATYHGKVAGDRIEGMAGPTANRRNWNAARKG